MNVKILSFFILFSVSYLLAVFFAPKEADEMAAFLGFSKVNQSIRELKASSDNFSEKLTNPKAQFLSGATGSFVNDINNTIETVGSYTDALQGTVKNAKDVVQTKKQQVENLSNTIQKTTEVIGELKENTNALLEFSGSQNTDNQNKQNSGSSVMVQASGSLTESSSATGNLSKSSINTSAQ